MPINRNALPSEPSLYTALHIESILC